MIIMNIRKSIFLTILIFSSSIQANPWNDFRTDFDVFIDNLEKAGKESERIYLVNELKSLHKSMYGIERSKEYLIIILGNKNIASENLSSSINDLKNETKSAQNALLNIGNRVSIISESSNQLDEDLNQSLISRKAWLMQLEASDLFKYGVPSNTIDEGKLAIDSLKNARKKLEFFLRSYEPNKQKQPDA